MPSQPCSSGRLVHHFVLSSKPAKVNCHELLSSQQAFDTGMCVQCSDFDLGCSWKGICYWTAGIKELTCLPIFYFDMKEHFEFLLSCHVVIESILDQLALKWPSPKEGPYTNHYK